MKLKITYRPGSRPIYLESKEKTLSALLLDFSKQLANNYASWRIKQGNPISRQSLKRYEIGQYYMLKMKIEERLK